MAKRTTDDSLATRLAKAIEASPYLSKRAASIAAGLSAGAAQDIISGKSKKPANSTIRAFARLLQVDSRWLGGEIDDTGNPSPDAPVYLPVRHKVGAGNWRERDDAAQDFLGEGPVAPSAAYRKMPQWLELVEGDSVDLVYPHGALIHVVDAIALAYTPRHGDLVVIERRRNGLAERTVKEIEIIRGGQVRARGRSNNKKWNQPIEISQGLNDHDEVTIVGLVVGAYLQRKPGDL